MCEGDQLNINFITFMLIYQLLITLAIDVIIIIIIITSSKYYYYYYYYYYYTHALSVQDLCVQHKQPSLVNNHRWTIRNCSRQRDVTTCHLILDIYCNFYNSRADGEGRVEVGENGQNSGGCRLGQPLNLHALSFSPSFVLERQWQATQNAIKSEKTTEKT